MTPDRLRHLLAVLDWSQRGLARLLDAHKTDVERWATGKQPIPGPVAEWLETLAAVHAAYPAPEWRRSRLQPDLLKSGR